MIIPVTSIFIMLTFVGMGDQYTLTPGTNRMISLSAFFLLLMNLLVFGINQYNREKIGIYRGAAVTAEGNRFYGIL